MVMLENCRLFQNLPAKDFALLNASAQEKHFRKDQEIFKEGDLGDGMYVVKEGQVQISGVVEKNTQQVFSRVEPGEIFGEMAVIENKPRSANAAAATDATVYFIGRETMLKLMQVSPQISSELLREVSNRLREFNRHYIQEVLQTERLALVGRFARSIVHDLKNPLNIISITAELAGMGKSTPESRAIGKHRIMKQVERITDLVNEILEYTQGSQTAFVPATTEYKSYVEQLIEEIRAEIELKSATIELGNPPPELKLLLNPKRLRRVFYNLIHNATDAMPRGGKITISFKQTPTEVITEIEDSGPGVAPEIADRLFDAFATYGKAHGTGLGLSICKKIIEDHHGRISARNEPGHGAIFSFTLPISTTI